MRVYKLVRGGITGAGHGRKTFNRTRRFDSYTTDEDLWIKMSCSIDCFPAVICSSKYPLINDTHTYMNRPITAPELESKKLKCVQVNERVPDGYWPISS